MTIVSWMRAGILALCLIATGSPPHADARASRGGHAHNSSSSGGSRVHVKGYFRKDGTYVAPHERAASGYGSYGGSTSFRRSYTPRSYHTLSASHWRSSSGYFRRNSSGSSSWYSLPHRDSHGRFVRSMEAKDRFKRSHPCPSTGRSSGPCPGYVIDHVRALKHGGADDPNNMQWQTVSEAKAKDRWE